MVVAWQHKRTNSARMRGTRWSYWMLGKEYNVIQLVPKDQSNDTRSFECPPKTTELSKDWIYLSKEHTCHNHSLSELSSLDLFVFKLSPSCSILSSLPEFSSSSSSFTWESRPVVVWLGTRHSSLWNRKAYHSRKEHELEHLPSSHHYR